MSFENAVRPLGRGLTINVPGHTLVMPRLTLGQRKATSELIKALSDEETPETAEAQETAVLEIVQKALARHYPNVTVDDIRDNFSDEDVIEAWFYAMNVTRKEGETAKNEPAA